MVLASELLDLIGASDLSFEDVGGVAGLIKTNVFQSKENLHKLLSLLDNYTIPDDAVDGYSEDLAFNGFSEAQVQAIIEVGLIEYLR